MNETPISWADIEGLAATLDGLYLPPGQRALLSAIVTMAARAIPEDPSAATGSFAEQFAEAFTPGRATFLVERARDNIGQG